MGWDREEVVKKTDNGREGGMGLRAVGSVGRTVVKGRRQDLLRDVRTEDNFARVWRGVVLGDGNLEAWRDLGT